MRFWPLLFRPRGRVQEHGISRSAGRKPRAIETKLRSSLRRITKREPAQNPVALNRVKLAADAMANIVKEMTPAAPGCLMRHNRDADHALRVQ